MNHPQPFTFPICPRSAGGRFRAFVATVVLVGAGAVVHAQSFTLQTNIVMRGVAFGAVAWGDYDRNGTLDLALSGNVVQNGQSLGYVTELYRNNDIGTFTAQAGSPLTGGYFPGLAWGDVNRDGYLDLLVASAIPPALPRSQVWQNAGNSTFSVQTNIVLAGLDFASVAWGDYDNDGHQDLLLTGFTGVANTPPVSKVYRNKGDGTFDEQTGIVLTGVESSSVTWGDYDNDGDLDILLTGAGTDGPVSKVYRNDGGGSFSEQTSIVLARVSVSSVAWGDYDNDGFLDILLVGTGGEPNYTATAKVYRNQGNGAFLDQTSIVLSGISSPTADWGDYDNDGRLDILMAGVAGSPTFGPVTKVYRNLGNHTFSEQANALQPAASFHFPSAAWGDYDHDGRLDILVSGLDSIANSTASRLYRNTVPTINTPPTAPTGLTATVTPYNGAIRLAWLPATDSKTPAKGLSYNLRVGTAPGLDNVVPCLADTASGRRRLPALGNVNHNIAWTVRGLNPGQTYYWSVQAVDTALAGGAWATEASFPGATAFPIKGQSAQPDFDGDHAADLGVFHAQTGNWYMRQSLDGGQFSGGPVAWGWSAAMPIPGDFDGDARADLAVYVPSEGKWYVLRSGDGGKQTIVLGGNGMVPVVADYDGDGRADAAVFKQSTGEWTVRLSKSGTLLRGGTFAFGWHETIPVPGDYDGDGKADIAVFWPAGGLWYVSLSSTGALLGGAPQAFGWAGNLPVQGDYDGDGRTDLAIYDPPSGNWYVRQSSNGGLLTGAPINWGAAVAMPVPNDYTGDGKTDIAVYVPKNGKWYIRQSHNGSLLGGGNSAAGGLSWGHPAVTPANAQYQTLKAMGLAL